MKLNLRYKSLIEHFRLSSFAIKSILFNTEHCKVAQAEFDP